MAEVKRDSKDRRGSVRGGERGRGQGRGNRGCGTGGPGRRQGRNITTIASVLKGNAAGMNMYMFQCYDKTPDRQQHNKTLEALAGYINKTMDFLKDVSSLCTKFRLENAQESRDFTEEGKQSNMKKLI